MSLLPHTSLSDFGLSEENLNLIGDRTLVVENWNWDFSLAHAFQKHCLNLLTESPRMRILICCNHPRVFTDGRGLQRPRKGEKLDLIEFKSEASPKLPYPLHKIERGGGLTFHHPGQFIFYPILKLNPATLSLSKMTDEIFSFSAEVLKEWGLTNLSHETKLMGLWHGNHKLASMGLAIEKLTTFHGMALNIFNDQEMKRAMQNLNPCGLSSNIYTSVEELITLPNKALEKFTENFLKRISNAWQ